MSATTVTMKSIPYDSVFSGNSLPQGGHSTDRETDGWRFDELVTVRRIVVVASFLMAFALVALGVSTAQGASLHGWYHSFDDAARQSARTGKPLMVLIARTGCPACAEMERNLVQPGIERALRGAVRVRLESSEYPSMTGRYAKGGTPTTLVYPAGETERPVYSYTGVMSPATLKRLGLSLDSMDKR